MRILPSLCGKMTNTWIFMTEKHIPNFNYGCFSRSFFESHCWAKLKAADYDFIRNKLVTKGFDALTGKDGKWIQARKKGIGGINPRTGQRRPITRAFYARTSLVKKIFEIAS